MALLLLNRVVKNQQPKELFDIIMSHLVLPKDWCIGCEILSNHRMNGEAPLIIANNSNTINANQTVLKRIFPVNCQDWFNKLPWEIRYKIGSKKFDHEILDHYRSHCFHRITTTEDKCSDCKTKTNFDNINIEEVLEDIQLEYDDENALSQKMKNQIISLETILSCILLKINNEEKLGKGFEDTGGWAMGDGELQKLLFRIVKSAQGPSI